MKGSWRLVVGFGSLLALLLLVEVGFTQNEVKPTTLKVTLPQRRARVEVNGKVITGKRGDVREFEAPVLEKGKTDYEIMVSWATNDYTRFRRVAKVAPKPGQTVAVDLSKEDPKNRDKIEIRYVPTPQDVVDRMCKLGKIDKEDIVYDLGCGDGRMVITAVKDFKAKRGVGVDFDEERVKESKAAAVEAKLTDKLEFRKGDVLDIKDLSDATVVLLYMGDDVNLRLRPILQKTLKPGSRIVSHRFEMGDWKPEKTETFIADDGDEYSIHLWTIKKKDD